MSLPQIPAYRLEENLPESVVDWRPDPDRSALLVHDFQEYFVRRFDRSRTDAQINRALETTAGLIRQARSLQVPVVYTAQPPRQHPSDRALLTDFWGDGLQTDAEAEVVPEVAPQEGDLVLAKWRYSAFMRTSLRDQLAARRRDQLVITGIYAHIGCLATALDAFMLDVQPFLVQDGTADFSAEEHRIGLAWAARRCARVMDGEQVRRDWSVAADGPQGTDGAPA